MEQTDEQFIKNNLKPGPNLSLIFSGYIKMNDLHIYMCVYLYRLLHIVISGIIKPFQQTAEKKFYRTKDGRDINSLKNWN